MKTEELLDLLGEALSHVKDPKLHAKIEAVIDDANYGDRYKGCGYDRVCKSGYCSACERLYGIKHIGGLK